MPIFLACPPGTAGFGNFTRRLGKSLLISLQILRGIHYFATPSTPHPLFISMRLFRFIFSLSLLSVVLWALQVSWSVGGSDAPPFGYFLDPFQGFWQNAERPSHQYPGELALEGLKAPVRVLYDQDNIPHIFAENEHDLYMAQGYVVAQHRLWQMEFQTHAAAGRLSEIVGEMALNYDREQRRKGMVDGATATLEEVKKDDAFYAFIEAYASGVNQYINQLHYKHLPIEYKLLNYRPEPWTPLKSALIQEYMIENLSGWDNDLENTNAYSLFGKETFEFLFPDRLPGIEPVVPTDAPWGFEATDLPIPAGEYPMVRTEKTREKPDPSNGSNNWAVAGSKTKSGKPILANDTHLGLNFPSLWILMQLHAPGINVYGYTFTGGVGITIGFNEHIAWGFTNAPRDTRDWYRIEFDDSIAREKYLHHDAWHPVVKKVEQFIIKGGEPFYDTILYTVHGPVMYDRNFPINKEKTNLALRWKGHDPALTQKAIYGLNRAKNYEEYRQALEHWDAPAQNVVFASIDGDIALRIEGMFPHKWPGQGKFIMDGNNPDHMWQSLIPREHNAYQRNPERGFVASANQHSTDEQYPYWFFNGSNEYHRNRRINRLLSSMEEITPEDMMAMHNDSHSAKAEDALPIFVEKVQLDKLSPEALQVVERLIRWNFSFSAASDLPAWFDVWWSKFYHLTWDEFRGHDLALSYPNSYTLLHIMQHFPESAFFDIRATEAEETMSDIITMALMEAMEEVERWKSKNTKDFTWTNYKNSSVIHLARLAPFGRYGIPIDGHGDAINASKGNHGPSQRLVVEMTSPPTAWGIYPGGQSGNPGSHRYDDFLDEWARGDFRPLIFLLSPADQQEAIRYQQQLSPKN
jgi:penicillin G amidase